MKDAIIGIDPDTKRITAVVTVDDVPTLRRKVLPKNVTASRWTDVAWVWVYRLVKEYKDAGYAVHVGIEQPFVSPHTIRAAIPLCRLNGVMLAAARRAKADSIHEVGIQVWKKDIVGKGNSDKPAISAWCKIHWRNMWDEAQKFTAAEGRQDIIDASAINRHTVNVVRRMKDIEVFYGTHQEEAADKKARTRKRLVKN